MLLRRRGEDGSLLRLKPLLSAWPLRKVDETAQFGYQASRPVLPEDVWHQVRDILVRSSAISIVALGLDWTPSHQDLVSAAGRWISVALVRTGLITHPITLWPFGHIFTLDHLAVPNVGPELVQGLLKTVVFLPALLLALTSLAVTGLGPYVNPALLLLYRRYQMKWWERPFLISGRTNELYRTIVLGLGLVGSLSVLTVSKTLGSSHNDLPAVAYVLILTGLLTASLLSFTFLIVSLRRPGDIIRLTFQAGLDVLQHVQRLYDRKRELSRLRYPEASPTFPSLFEEQLEIKQCVYTLTAIAIRSLEDRQRLAALEATATLGRLDVEASRIKVPLSWRTLAPKKDDPDWSQDQPDWLAELFVQGIESVILEAADLHFLTVGSQGAKQLRKIGLRLSSPEPRWPGRNRVVPRVIKAFENTVDESVVAKEFDLRDELLGHFKSVVAAAALDPELWGEAVGCQLRDRVVGMLKRCVVDGDIPSLRAVQSCIEEMAMKFRITEPAVTMALLDIGATALGSRVYGTTAALCDFVALTYDPSGERCYFAIPAIDESAVPKADLPTYVKMEYYQLFVFLVVGRAQSFDPQNWAGGPQITACDFSASVPRRGLRAELTIRRVSNVVSYPPAEMENWVKCVRALDAAEAMVP